MTGTPLLRYLAATDVAAAMPEIDERLDLAEQALRALGATAQMPPKIGVHPRRPGSLGHAMPALLPGAGDDGSNDLLGIKWITGFPQNPAAGLPTYHALTIVNDPTSGLPLAVLDAGPITAQRTAAVSGVAIRLFGPEPRPGLQVAILGAGAQARAHLAVVGRLLPEAAIRLVDVDRGRATSLAGEAQKVPGISAATVASNVREAIQGADVVVSAVSFGAEHQALDSGWLAPDVTFVAVDYDMQAAAALAREALFIVDERNQFLATRDAGGFFESYPEPDATLGQALREGLARPQGRVLVCHLGTGLTDVVFAAAILRRAEQLGLGTLLPR